MKLFLSLCLLATMTQAANYTTHKTIEDGVEIVRLGDASHSTEAAIAIGAGNLAFELKVKGRNLLYFPFSSPAEWLRKPTLCGIPFLAPWANRIDGLTFYANGKPYALNPALGNLRTDGNGLPIHGTLAFTRLWHLVEVKGSETEAYVTSELEFWRYPDLMAQFPFAHSLRMTYRLSDGNLFVTTTIRNMANEPMPVSIGFHPYFQLHDAPRDAWRVHLAARQHVLLSNKLIPTGELEPSHFSSSLALAGTQLDDVFTALERGPNGQAEFWVEGKHERITVAYGPHYPIAVVYAPPGKEFICFEPMAGLTNAMNLAHAGKYPDLQSIPAGGTWSETFSVRPSGF